MGRPIMRVSCAAAAAIGWFSLVLQYVVGNAYQSPALTLNFFSYFTILSNILAATMLTVAALRPEEPRPWLTRPRAATAIALYMTVTGLVYVFILQSLWNPQGWAFVADSGLHHVMPVLVVLCWLAFVPKGTLAPRAVPAWLIFPLLYGVYSLARGPFADWYPYPFIDAGKLGYSQTALNIVLLLVGFIVLAGIYVALDRALAGIRPAKATAR